MSKDKIKKVRVNQTIQISSLRSRIMKGTELSAERNPDILKTLLESLEDKDISSNPSDKTLVTVIEMDKEVEKPAPVEEESPKSERKTSGNKKSGKKSGKKGDN